MDRSANFKIFDGCLLNTFAMCGGISSLKIPSSLMHLGAEAFFDCGSLSEFKSDNADGTHFTVRCGVLYSDGGETLVAYPPARRDAELAVPKGAVKVARGGVRHIEIP